MVAPLVFPAEVREACRLLFASDDPAVLGALDSAMVKRRFREMAKECHPDRAKALGRQAAELEQAFRRLQRLSHVLAAWVGAHPAPGQRRRTAPRAPEEAVRARRATAGGAARRSRTWARGAHAPPQSPPPPPPPSGQPDPPRRASLADEHKVRPLPPRRMLLGEYLWYAGLISHRQLVAALVWQRRQRPLIGELAKTWGWLDAVQIQRVLASRSAGERFGDCAQRLGLLTLFQRYALVGRQRGLQERLGTWFVREGLLSSAQLEQAEQAVQTHNRSVLFANGC